MPREDYDEVKRVEFLLYPNRYKEDKELSEWMDQQKNRSDAIRNVLIDHVRGSRYGEQQRTIEKLQHELELMQKVVDKLASKG